MTKEEALYMNGIGGGHFQYRSQILKAMDDWAVNLCEVKHKNALQDVDDSLETIATKLKLNVDLSDKQYEGDKVVPMDRLGVIDWLFDNFELNNEELRKCRAWHQYEDWKEFHYQYDDYTGEYCQKGKGGSVLPFSGGIKEMDIRRKFIEENNL